MLYLQLTTNYMSCSFFLLFIFFLFVVHAFSCTIDYLPQTTDPIYLTWLNTAFAFTSAQIPSWPTLAQDIKHTEKGQQVSPEEALRKLLSCGFQPWQQSATLPSQFQRWITELVLNIVATCSYIFWEVRVGVGVSQKIYNCTGPSYYTAFRLCIKL